jgi:hypothetical protein
MQHTMQLQYETVKYATGYVNDTGPTGFGDIHYDIETSDLSNGDQFGQAFIDGQLVNTNGQRPQDLFNGSTLGTIGSQGILFDNLSNLTFGGVVNTALGKVANNLLSGQKPTSNILVPFIGKASIQDLNATDITNIVVNNVTNYGTNDSISSQGQSIGTPLFTSTPANTQVTNIGYANTVPNSTGTVGAPNRISSTTTYQTSSTSAGTRQQAVDLAQKRLQDPNISAEQRVYYEEKIRLSNL